MPSDGPREGIAGNESGRSKPSSSPSSSSIGIGALEIECRRGEEAWDRTDDRECRDLDEDEEGEGGRAKWEAEGERSNEGSFVQSSEGTKTPAGGGGGIGDILLRSESCRES